MIDMTKTPDQRALEAVTGPQLDPIDPLTDPAVNAFLAPFRDIDPVTGLPLAKKASQVSEAGFMVFCTTAYNIMVGTDAASSLTDREVLTLVLTCDAAETYRRPEWDLLVKQQAERSAAYLAASNAHARKKNGSSERQSRARDQHRLPVPPKGYRNANLKHGQKMRVTASLRAASERRDRRREAHGIVIIPGRQAFKAMTVPEVQQLRLTQEELMLKNASLLQAMEEEMNGPEVDHVGFLYKYGRVPRQDNEGLRLTSGWARGTL